MQRFTFRRLGLLVAAVALLTGTLSLSGGAAGAASGGPIIIMGIDAEDGGVGGHGPITVYQNAVSSLLGNVSNGGSGLLVIGGGKDPGDDVTTFWDALAAGIGQSVTYVNGETAIASQSFSGFAVIAVVSSEEETGDGGLEDPEADALVPRAGDIAAFVNGGGGLIAFSQTELVSAYGFLSDIGAFTSNQDDSYEEIFPTPEGTAVGITTELNVCCWHDTYPTFPDFLQVLATAPNGEAAAIGGADVVIPTGITLAPDTASVTVGDTHQVTATVEEDSAPLADATVTFTVTDGPNAGTTGQAVTGSDGTATFSYSGTVVGTDSIQASYTDSLEREQVSNVVTVDWVAATPVDPGQVPEPAPPAEPVPAQPDFTG
ncbi:MAG TPA: Ig-like domain-containing protein [Acidimicrobiia bacterium]|nr:Ig-like domain-containing protein [Acidimicrobiia bacterium]